MSSRDEYVKGAVLESRPYREKDRMISFYSQTKGKIIIFIRGGMRFSSKLAPMVSEPFALLNLKVVRGRHYYHLIGGEIIKSFKNIEKDYRRLLRLTETFQNINKVLPRGEKNDNVYLLIKEFLNIINYKYSILIFISFIIKLLCFLGFMPELNKCLICKKSLSQGYFDIENGGLVCKKHKTAKSFKLSNDLLSLLQNLIFKSFKQLLLKDYSKKDILRAKHIIESFYSWQV